MAMHRKLDVGSILFTYHEPEYLGHYNRTPEHKYRIIFKVLHVHNRRERTSGTQVPASLKSTLDKLSIRYDDRGYYGERDCIYAIGCRSLNYYSCLSDLPYPSAEDVEAARRELESRLENNNLYYGDVSLMEIDFIEDFKEKKMSNKDALFSLSKSLEDYVSNETTLYC